MDFKITITRPPLSADFDAGSIAEAVGILEQEESALLNMFAIADKLSGGGATTEVAAVETASGEGGGKPPRKPRTPKAEAVAPAPIPVPGAAPASPPDLTIPADGSVPGFLRAPAAAPPPPAPPVAAAPPPPPLLPAAPPIVPPTPPTGVLAPKVVAVLEQKKAQSIDGGKALADWLAVCGLTVPGMSYDEAVAAVLFIADDKIAPIAKALEII